MSETCTRCGHTTPNCPHCGTTTRHQTLGGRINGKPYCHTYILNRPTCYETTLHELAAQPTSDTPRPAQPPALVMDENGRSHTVMQIHLQAGHTYTIHIGAAVPEGVTMDGGQPIIPVSERPTEPAVPPAPEVTCKCPMHGRPPRADPHGTHELGG